METAPRLVAPLRKPHARVGPYSRHGAIALIDGRSREAQYMRRLRRELVAHVGGQPNAVQRQLIERAVRLSLALELFDEQLMHEASFLAKDHNKYISWSNALARVLARLGLRSTSETPPSLAEALAAGRQP